MKRWLSLSQLARTNGSDKSRAGYTIVEVMVVLAVTTALFVAAAIAFSGRQARVEFTESVRNYESRLQAMISDVSNGYYQSDPIEYPGATGTHEDSIFLGKMIATGSRVSEIITVSGKRSVSGEIDDDVTTLTEAEPDAADNIQEQYTHSFQLEVIRVVSLTDNTTEVALFGFLNRLSGGSLIAPSRRVQLYGVLNTTVPETRMAAINDIEVDPPILVHLSDGIIICLRGQNNQRAEVTVGNTNSETAIFSVLDTPNSGVCSA
jgi:type II secretory pathway pseudopilin PulG